ncbi:type VII secretion target [Gordonia sp. CPCC 205515]|uniref:type VII secretion target n=1 Tax=Gordonia sp. CPCC 205515 TaxID=3140791 RepID=UPI003AF33C21
MAELNVELDDVHSFGVRTEDRGTTVSVEGKRGEFDTAVMTSVFGLIGADFMAVASLVTNTHNRQIGDLGKRYSEIGRAVMSAANSYSDTDSQNAKQLGGVGSAAKSLAGASANLGKGLDPTSNSLTREQVARIIIDRGHKMGMSDDEIKSAIATGIVESNLQNITYGDRDSVGVFQQRDFAPWTVNGRNRTNVDDAATSYYEQLKGTSGSPGDRAQAVQRSAFPDRYAERMGEASQLFSSLNTSGPVAATAQTTAPADGTQVKA